MEGRTEGMRERGRPRESWIGEVQELVGMGPVEGSKHILFMLYFADLEYVDTINIW